MCEVGDALKTVTELSLGVKDTGNSTTTAAILNEALARVLKACPSVKRLCYCSPFSTSVLGAVGSTCPQLLELILLLSGDDNAMVQSIMQIQPTLFKHLNCLILLELGEDLPDMSCSNSICRIFLPEFRFDTEHQWRHLPPNLQYLHALRVETGPPAFSTTGSSRNLLASLLRLGTSCPSMPLGALIRLLLAAPALTEIKVGCENAADGTTPDADQYNIVVDCMAHLSSAKALANGLNMVLQKASMDSLLNATYYFNCSDALPSGSWQSVLPTLPLMTGFTSCIIDSCETAVIQKLLGLFPDIRNLVIAHLDLDDIQLVSVLVGLRKLIKLRICSCPKFGLNGLIALCLRLPSLCHVQCEGCDMLDIADLEKCKKLMPRNILLIEDELSYVFQHKRWF